MHIAQTEQKVQYQVVAVLTLLALFTGEALYWVASLLLAMSIFQISPAGSLEWQTLLNVLHGKTNVALSQ